MDRRAFTGTVAGGLVIARSLALAQPTASLRRIGFLTFSSEATSAHLRAAFKEGMQDLGWLEGKNVEYRYVYADNDVGRLDAMVSELIGQKVEVIVLASQQTA